MPFHIFRSIKVKNASAQAAIEAIEQQRYDATVSEDLLTSGYVLSPKLHTKPLPAPHVQAGNG
jgi:hypothetical protein